MTNIQCEIQPNVLLGLCLAGVACTTGIWYCICRMAFDGWRPPWRRIVQFVICGVVIVATSSSQSISLQAQQDHEQRLRELERNTIGLTGRQETHEKVQTQINATILANLEKMEYRLEGIDLRVKQNETGRTRTEFVPIIIEFVLNLLAVMVALLGLRFVDRRGNGKNGNGNGAASRLSART